MTEWDIQSRSSFCMECQQPFEDKQAYHTLLSIGPGGYQRRDVCLNCSAKLSRDAVLSFWQGEYNVPPPPAPEPIQKDTAESLLRKLVESGDGAQSAARYILAVMLERKRILKHRDTVQDEQGNDLLVYEHAKTGETFTLPDPHLRLDQLHEVQEQVGSLLGTPPAGGETASPAGQP